MTHLSTLLRSVLAFAFLSGSLASAATIVGNVYDADNAIYLESIPVRLTDPLGNELRSTTTARAGRFRFSNLAPGSYRLVSTPIGYPAVRQSITITNDFDEAVANLVISREGVSEEVFELEELVVEGRLIGDAKSLAQRRAASILQEVVAADSFGNFADRNPGEALQRVAGVAVEQDQGEGSFIIIRGASPDLNSVQIDGVSLASPQEDGRRVNLNVITNDQIERIELTKTWLPTQKGGVVGGTVNIVTRSALDRGKMFASIEVAGTYREIFDEEESWRGAVTFGDVIDKENFEWFGDVAIGLQVSVNGSKDYQGSDTVTWGWTGAKQYPFLTEPGDSDGPPMGFTLDSEQFRNFNIQRDRQGASARLEVRFNENHEIYASASLNQFDDVEIEHFFDIDALNVGQFYAGTRVLTDAVVEQLGLDPEDPFVKQRLALPPNSANAALTYNEAILLGELAYDPDLNLFTIGGVWTNNMDRTFVHTTRTDRIDTFQIGGRHRLWWDLNVDWKAFRSEASQERVRNWLEFASTGSAKGAVSRAGPGLENPVIQDLNVENPTFYQKEIFRIWGGGSGTSGVQRQFDLLDASDKREGFELDAKKPFNLGEFDLTTQVGVAYEDRVKTYTVDDNNYRVNRSSFDVARIPSENLSLADEFFDGGDIEGFEANFGEVLRFGPSFDETNTLEFLQDPESFGVTFLQDPNDLNANFAERVRTNYDATEEILGYYLQQSIDWKDWKLIFGFRYEETKNTFTNLSINTRNTDPEFPALTFIRPSFWRLLDESIYSTVVTSEKEYDHLLPAVHLIRTIGERMKIRASVSKTIARPRFTDLIPREIPSIDGSNFGNNLTLPAFDLRPMESINYDLSGDYYFEPVGLISVAAFYKSLDGPIYSETRNSVGPNEETVEYSERYTALGRNDRAYNISRIRNSGEGKLLGFEITMDRKFTFLPGFWNGFGVNSNAAWFDSEATLLTAGRIGETVTLFQQPKYTANLSVYYNKYNIFARLSYNLVGVYLNDIETNEDLATRFDSGSFDPHVDKLARLDFTIRYNITPHFQVFFDGVNLTNEPLARFIGEDSRPTLKQYTERIFTVGVKWNL